MNKQDNQELRTNKQELISKYELIKNSYKFDTVSTDGIISDLKRLDEPQKVTIPQFVADWYEEHKDDLEYDIWEYILRWGKQQKSEFYEWMNHANNKPFQTLINMHQFGYEVEKEPKYTVKIKATKHYFAKDGNGRIYFSLKYESAFTKIELEKANLGWVFDCEGIEIEEVE